MTGSESDTSGVSFEEIDADISADQSNLLATLHAAEDGMPTGRLREGTGIPSGSMHYDLSRLESWGLIEVIGRRPEGSGSPSKVWTTTERGKSFLTQPGVTGPRTFQELMTHIEDLERDLTRREERIETLESDVDELKEAYNELASALEQHLNE